MRWLERIEPYFDWLHFQGLFKYLTFIGVIAFACQWARPDVAMLLDFDREKILSGEVWRVVTFIFVELGGWSYTPFGVLFLFFAVQISFLISDSLESVWGSTRTTLYILTAWIGLVVTQFLVPVSWPASGMLLYTSLFFAFATLFPRVEFSLFFLIPVQVRILAWIAGILLAYKAVKYGAWALLVPTMLPYALWVLPNVIHGRKSLVKAAQRRRKFQIASRPETQAFHRCETCGRTERDPGDLEFFTLPDGKEYCHEHLPQQG